MITDSSGKVISRDRGNYTGSYTFDFGTGEFNYLGDELHGPHPMFGVDLCLAVEPLTGISDSAKYLTERPIGSTDSPAGYDEYLPPSYTATGAQSPLLLFFHGYGETGDGTPEAISRLVAAGIPKYINVGGWPTDRPFVVLAPQHVEDPPGFDFSSCDGAQFGGSCNMQVQHENRNVQPAFCTTPNEVRDFIDYAVTHYNVDPSRVYITGLSCGAFGIWEYLGFYGGDNKVAAAVPIAGEGRPAFATASCNLGDTPIWAFTGLLEDTVDPQGSIEPHDGAPGRLRRPGRPGEADRLPGSGPQQLGSGLRRRERRRHLFLDARLHESLRVLRSGARIRPPRSAFTL